MGHRQNNKRNPPVRRATISAGHTMRSTLSLLLLALMASTVISAPQDLSSSSTTEATFEEELNPDYGEYDPSQESDNLVTPTRSSGGGLLQGIFNLITGGFKVAQDERVQNTVVNGVHVAMNATGEILKTGSQVLTAAPRAASRQANLLGGLVKVANESTVSIGSRLDELDRFSKLFSTFVRSYQN